MGPLLTLPVVEQLRAAVRSGAGVECSLDLHRSSTTVTADEAGWLWQGQRYPWPARCRDRTIYYWDGVAFEPASRYSTSLVKLVPTDWGPPTFEIDGIKMLPTAKISPYVDAGQKVDLVQPAGKTILDTCGGLGYFAAWCLHRQAQRVISFEKNPDVIWLRGLNPWSPAAESALEFAQGDIAVRILEIPSRSVDAVLHDPPRFGTAGELYSQQFYDELARVMRRKGRLFHYTGTPNKLTSGRDVPHEVATRLQRAGFAVQASGDGLLALRN